MEVDIGRKHFSFTLDDSLSREEMKKIGRAIQYRNQKKMIATFLVISILIVLVTLYVSRVAILLYIVLLVQVAVYLEFGSRSIVDNLKKKFPISYDFYEDGLIEHMEGKDTLLMYDQFSGINMNQYVFTMVGKKNEVVVIPRNRLDEESTELVMKLGRILARRKKRVLKTSKKKSS